MLLFKNKNCFFWHGKDTNFESSKKTYLLLHRSENTSMAKNLVIVESPAKAKTIEKFLGKEFKVASSYGHIADLPSNELGVAVESSFTPKYIVSQDKKKVVGELKKLAKTAQTVWLASDEDREGEAIAWHLANQLNLSDKNSKRIVFSEITKSAILKAIDKPRKINYDLVNAQQARRVLDRLVGYELSPVLWKKIKTGLSAGRVQSVAVRLIVEREREINAFKPKELFKTRGQFKTLSGINFEAQYEKDFDNEIDTRAFLEGHKTATFSVNDIQVKPGKKTPAPPFTTSTLQQEASRKLYFSVSKTMNLAQRLYEAGLITYMRTDSVNLSQEAQGTIHKKIVETFGDAYLQKRKFKTKNKGAQEAHEAIRPTNPSNESIEHLEYDQKRLYELIWKRTIASQMADAALERTKILIRSTATATPFSAKGEVITFDGFLKLYIEGMDDNEEELTGLLPKMTQGENVEMQSLISTQRFSKPPYRYSEASLVKKLEELGIGRPSTYAPTISTVQNRGYVERGTSEGQQRSYMQLKWEGQSLKEGRLTERVGADKGKLVPTDIGNIVNDFLVAHFESVLDFNFTAQVETTFDNIARGEEDWTKMIKQFYGNFHPTVEHVKDNVQRESGERELGVDPKSGRPIKVRLGKFGPMAQIGNATDETPPQFASLTPDQQLETITFEEALALFELPKSLGEYENIEVQVNSGRYGPYIKYDKIFVSLPKGIDPRNVDLNQAIEFIEEKKKAEAPIYNFQELPVTKGVGRFGPFLKWNGLFINVNKKYDFDNLSSTDIETLIQEKIQKEKDKLIHHWEAEKIRVEKARWGRSAIIMGRKKIELPKTVDATKITLEEAKQYLGLGAKTKTKRKTKKA